MDIFSHGLWAGAAYKAINKKTAKPLNTRLAVFWGVFPDLFAFAIPFAWLFWNLIFGGLKFSDVPGPHEGEPPPQDRFWVFHLATILYNLSHSLIIFLIVFCVFWLILRRPFWELGGWFLHILIDIPTHTYKFYPTPFLWPVSSWKLDGFSWGTPWFLVWNYIFIVIIFWWLKKDKGKPRHEKTTR